MPKFIGFDHIDMRVPSLAAVETFYDALLPALGLSRTKYSHVDARGDWHDPDDDHPTNAKEYYEPKVAGRPSSFIGIIEDGSMRPTLTRIAFRVASRAALNDWEERIVAIGARCVERSAEMDAYPALFFEDPAGTKLELHAVDPS